MLSSCPSGFSGGVWPLALLSPLGWASSWSGGALGWFSVSSPSWRVAVVPSRAVILPTTELVTWGVEVLEVAF